MTNTLPDWCRHAGVAAVVAVYAALSLGHEGGPEPLKAAASQAAAAPSNSLEILAVRPSFFVIAGAGANIGVQVGEDGVVAVDAGPAADAPAVLAAIKRISPKPIRYIINTGPDADHVGGNEALSRAGEKFFSRSILGGDQTWTQWHQFSRPREFCGIWRSLHPADGLPRCFTIRANTCT